jgi:hypothetical protein
MRRSSRLLHLGERKLHLRLTLGFLVALFALSLGPIGWSQQRAVAPQPLPFANRLDPDQEEDAEDEPWQGGAFPKMTRQNIRESIFGGLGGSEAAFQKSKRDEIRRELDRVNSICPLSEEQKEKLEVAIEIDIQHVMTSIETAISKYDTKMTIQQFQQIQSEVQQILAALKSNKKGTEIWQKVLQNQLTPSQRESLERDRILVEENRLRTQRLKTLLGLQRKLGLTAPQRASVLRWLSRDDHQELDFAAVFQLLAKSDESDFNWTPAQRSTLDTPLQQIMLEPPAQRLKIQNIFRAPNVPMVPIVPKALEIPPDLRIPKDPNIPKDKVR